MRVQSRKPGKQRKALYTVKNHVRSSLLNCSLDDTLRQEVGIRRLPIRKDDRVRVVKGEFKDIEGKVLKIRKKDRCVTVEECVNEKKDGSTYYVPLPVNRLRIMKFGEKKMDPWRQKIIDRRAKIWRELGVEPVGPKKERDAKEVKPAAKEGSSD